MDCSLLTKNFNLDVVSESWLMLSIFPCTPVMSDLSIGNLESYNCCPNFLVHFLWHDMRRVCVLHLLAKLRDMHRHVAASMHQQPKQQLFVVVSSIRLNDSIVC